MKYLFKQAVHNWLGAAVCLASLLASGCVMVVRHPANHSLSDAHLLTKPNYREVALVLQSPPTADFAFLLARRYPEAYIVVTPSDRWREAHTMYFSGETNTDVRMLEAKPGDKIRVLRGFTGLDVPIRKSLSRQLDKYIIFHQGHVVSCAELSDTWTHGPSIVLSWQRIKISDPAPENQWPLLSLIYAPIALASLGNLTPPLPTNYAGNPAFPNVLHIVIDGHNKITFMPRERSYKGYQMGWLWAVALIPVTHDGHSIWQDGGFSSGEYADCLEQMFRDSRVKRVAGRVEWNLEGKRRTEFWTMYEKAGFNLISYKLMADREEPDGPRFMWVSYDRNISKNNLVATWGDTDRILKK